MRSRTVGREGSDWPRSTITSQLFNRVPRGATGTLRPEQQDRVDPRSIRTSARHDTKGPSPGPQPRVARRTVAAMTTGPPSPRGAGLKEHLERQSLGYQNPFPSKLLSQPRYGMTPNSFKVGKRPDPQIAQTPDAEWWD